jgi:hypothetical protein
MSDANQETSLVRLAADQRKALESLLGGKSISETARAARVSRNTIYFWLRKDANFQAAYNQWRDQLQQSCQSRLLTLTEKAADALEKALERGDARAALALLKGMGMIAPPQIGPTDPQEATARMELEKQRRRIELKRDNGRAMMDEITAEMG